MKRKIAKRAVTGIILTVITLTVFFLLNDILVVKRSDGITDMKSYYAQERGTVDVLILGSSHAGMNLDAAELWEDYGIASFALWGSAQPFWSTYYFLKEALKTQTPDVICLDVFAACFPFDYSDDARQVTNVAGMHYNLNRLEAAMAAGPPERWVDLFLGLPLYHTRYEELTGDDLRYFPFSAHLADEKGTGWRSGVYEGSIEDVTKVTDRASLHPKEEEYLRRIIEYCKEKDIPLLLIGTPNSGSKAYIQQYFNTVADIAEEYSVEFIDYNLMDEETGLTADDYWTDGIHLNTEGARKISRHLGSRLVESYGVSDRRGDDAFASWDAFAEEVNEGYESLLAGDDAA